jgi:LCP family protein required for cell wall assembly
MVAPNYKLSQIGVLILVFAGFFLTGYFLAGHFSGLSSVADKMEKAKPVNILVMGIDARDAEENSRSDTMILASIDRKTKQIVMVWIPRDTRVEVSPNHYDKVNSVNALQGPEEACQVVGRLLGTRIDHYVVTNFFGFKNIVDILGGVNIEVESAMTHYDPNPEFSINLSPGQQRLTGAQALSYVRYRGGPTADIGRTARQQKFIKALAREMFKTSTIAKLPDLIPEISKHIHTNIPASDLLFLMQVARSFDATGIVTQTLPGYPFTDPNTGASYWEADQDIAQRILADLFAGKTYDVAQDPPHWVHPPIQPVTNEMLEEEVPPEPAEDPSEMNDPEGDITSEEGGTEEDLPPGEDTDPEEGNTDEDTQPEQEDDPSTGEDGDGTSDPETPELNASPGESDPGEGTNVEGAGVNANPENSRTNNSRNM